MGTNGLDAFFRPASVAVVGASEDPGSLGFTVMENMLAGRFHGPILPVTPRWRSVQGVLAYPSLDALPMTPDMAVLCTPPATLESLIGALGSRGTRAVAVMTTEMGGPEHAASRAALHAAAKPHGVRILGPASTGLQVPAVGLNASWISVAAPPGKLAFLSQSGSLAAGVLQWASRQGIGFSHVISTGDAIDVDFGDLLDWLAADPAAQAIVLYVRSITASRKFLSATRAVSHLKPVVAIKAGRRGQLCRVTDGEPTATVDADEVFDAALRRAGILRVHGTDELLDAVGTLACVKSAHGENLAIVCNGAGPGEVAADAVVVGGGRLAAFGVPTVEGIGAHLGRAWQGNNPIDLGRDATPERYQAVLAALLDDYRVDMVLVMHAPTSVARGHDVAAAVCKAAGKGKAKLLACWLGEADTGRVRDVFAALGIPTYPTPDKAARGFLHLIRYQRNQDMLMQVPVCLPPPDGADIGRARELVRQALAEGHTLLDEARTAAVLAAYGIPTVQTRLADSPDAAADVAAALGFPVALRLAEASVVRSMAVAGTAINLPTADSVRSTALDLRCRFRESFGDRPAPPLVVQKMQRRGDSLLLMASMTGDPLFGPVIRFGAGGAHRYIPGDYAVALPPLNASLADELIARTRVGMLLSSRTGAPVAAAEAVRLVLVHLSRLIVDMPEISAIEINPMLADRDGVVVLDARIGLDPTGTGRRLAIRPYPDDLEETVDLADGATILLRPVRPEDEPAFTTMIAKVTAEDLRLRFFHVFQGLPRSLRSRLIHIDYDRDMAFVATRTMGETVDILGMVNIVVDPRSHEAEYGILIRSDCQGLGLGRVLMDKIVGYCRQRGLGAVSGLVRADNTPMLNLCSRLGFQLIGGADEEEDLVEVRLPLG